MADPRIRAIRLAADGSLVVVDEVATTVQPEAGSAADRRRVRRYEEPR
ncbi:hypothetical protein [Nocardia otitidiscaviarum]|nr:hypothetical protein [Nocardia otitidiscaviarum]MBF6177157.1 hypothetical protein [Nocardia otitidiscaviarum]